MPAAHTASAISIPQPTIAQPVAAFVRSMFGFYDRAIVDAALPEPRLRAHDRVALTIDALTETLAGLAIGHTVSVVLAASRRTFDRSLVRELSRAAGRELARLDARPIARVVGVESAPVQSLGGELRHQLRCRLIAAARSSRAVLAELARVVASAAPHEAHVFDRAVQMLVDDPVLAEPMAAHLSAGWACASAILEDRRIEATGPWATWQRRVRGEREPVLLTHDEIVARGFVMQIG